METIRTITILLVHEDEKGSEDAYNGTYFAIALEVCIRGL